MSQPLFRKFLPLAGAVGLAAAFVAPLAAQGVSEGYEFLESVRKREAEKVTTVIDTPGSRLIDTRDIATGDTALHIVAERRDTVWLRFLAAKGANPNVANKKGVTPLMISADLGSLDGVEALIAAGAQVGVANALGETPLIGATHRRDFAMVGLLLRHGADPDRSDNSGRSARDYAGLIGSRRLVEEFTRADTERAASGKNYGPAL